MSDEPNAAPVSVPTTTGSRPWSAGDLLALAIWTLAVVVFFRDAVGLVKAFFYFDITEINFPYRDFLARELRLGRFSRWFPGLYCGQPLYSESQAGYLHPLTLLFFPWLETWKAFNLSVVLSVWLTGAGTYGWLRRTSSPVAALTGAAIFGASGFVWAHLIHTSMTNALVSVPFVIWGLEAAWAGARKRGVALGALALACQVFAGHLQDTLLTGALVGVYALWRAGFASTRRARLEALAIPTLLVAFGVGLAAVQWIPSKELLDRSPRAEGLSWEQLTYGSWHPELLPTLVVREAHGTRARDTDWMDGFYPYHEMNAYVGLVALMLAVIGGAGARDRRIAFWVFVAGFSLLLMLGRFTFLFDHLHRVPILGSSRIPVRFHLWMSLAIAALAAAGVDRIIRLGSVRLRSAFGFATLLVVASIPLLYYAYEPIWTEPKRWNTAYHAARFAWLGRELAIASIRTALVVGAAVVFLRLLVRARSEAIRSRLAWALPILILIDLFGSHLDDAPTIDPSYWTSAPRVVEFLRSEPNLGRVFGVADRSAGEPGYASEFVDFPASRETLGWSLAPVWGLRSSTGETPIIPRRMLLYTDNAAYPSGRFHIEGVTHVINSGPVLSVIDRNPVRIGSAQVHRNPRALPRLRILGRPIHVADEDAAARALTTRGADYPNRIIVEDPARSLAPDASSSGSARFVVDDPEHQVIEAELDAPGYLFIADAFDPGWTAEVDGTPAPILPADVAFRAIFLTKGTHRVELRYRPRGFVLGLGISLGTLALVLALGFAPLPRPTPASENDEIARPGRLGWIGLGLFCAIVLASAVTWNGSSLAIHDRWSGSFHRFTWGAGLEAINPVRGSIGR
ncbi:MAG: YfhO family protein [Isosphaeraceae bacterium]|nr:YfhO family protein [Isosphaeraceae bacterium]